MALACDMAKEANVEFSITEQAEQMFHKARENENLKLADEDFSAVFEQIYKETDNEVSQKRSTSK